jgi:DNA-binding response OmpR family regulator
MKALIVEDAPEVVESIRLCIAIRWPNSDIFSTAKGAEGLRFIEERSPDIVLVDIGLPDANGLDLVKEIRKFSDVPVVIVTARGDEISRLKGLEYGADDYIVKPFSHAELLARMRAVLRRTHMPELWQDEEIISGKSLSIDLAAGRVYLEGTEIPMSGTEWRLLAFLARNEGRIIPTEILAEKVWGLKYVESSTVKMCVRRLRQKLHDDARSSGIIRNHRGRGYSLALHG